METIKSSLAVPTAAKGIVFLFVGIFLISIGCSSKARAPGLFQSVDEHRKWYKEYQALEKSDTGIVESYVCPQYKVITMFGPYIDMDQRIAVGELYTSVGGKPFSTSTVDQILRDNRGSQSNRWKSYNPPKRSSDSLMYWVLVSPKSRFYDIEVNELSLREREELFYDDESIAFTTYSNEGGVYTLAVSTIEIARTGILQRQN